jgi:lipopolysaccharide transport system permease protein
MTSATIQAIRIAARPRRRITADSARWWSAWRWVELWRYRDLLWFLGGRDIRVRYKQTALGALWAILQPLATMLVFTVFFGHWLGVPRMTDPVFVYSGLLPWTLFAATTTAAAASVVANADIMRKVYFPRLILPLAASGAPLVDFLVAMAVLLGLMLWQGVGLTPQFALIPALIASTLLTALGVGTLLAAMTVAYRDFRHIVPFMLQLWFFATPVIFPAHVVPPRFGWVLAINPMAGQIEAYRAAIGGGAIDWQAWGGSCALAGALAVFGWAHFSRMEERFADVV